MDEQVISDVTRGDIWPAFGRAIGAEPREHKIIRGASGLDHAIEGIAVDDKGKRLIIVSAEPNPRTAAMVQVDIQATMPDVHVLMARPIAFDIGSIARSIALEIGQSEIDLKQLADATSDLKVAFGDSVPPSIERVIGPIANTFRRLSLPPVHQWMAAIQQLALLDWSFLRDAAETKNLIIPLHNLLTLDLMSFDREVGICPVPLHDFSEVEWEALLSGRNIDDVLECLKRAEVLQYFFPPADQVALAVADRLPRSSPREIIEAVTMTPTMGHPFGKMEILDSNTQITDVVDGLRQLGLAVEGELGVEVTPSGISQRATVKFKPREGLISKVLNRISVNVTPKDFFG